MFCPKVEVLEKWGYTFLMKIGLFDSGLGGLTVLFELTKFLPKYDYLYLGDNARAPYGDRSPQEIYQFTKEGVAWLFSQGATIVILACNTASCEALRRIQQEWLPQHFPNKRVLGIVIPIAQAVYAKTKGHIGIIGTRATVDSKVYVKEFHKLNPGLKIIQVAAPLLVPLLEEGAQKEKLKETLEIYLSLFQGISLGALVLGCTHYPLLIDEIRAIMGSDVFIPNVGEIVAHAFADYLSRHPEFLPEKSDGAGEGSQAFFTTGDAELFLRVSKHFFGTSVNAQRVELSRP